MSTKITRHFFCLMIMGLCLAFVAGACTQSPPAAPPPQTWPSVVTSEDGVHYYVTGLRVPGTRQELQVRRGDAHLWIPLAQISRIQFLSPGSDDFRPAEIFLVSGERLQVEVETNQILEGRTSAGYWNMPLSRMRSLEFGTE